MSGQYDVTFIERDERSARFLVRGISPAFANGIRRAMVADVPTLSVDTVRVIENSSVMFDEQIALRLGLIPLTTPDDYEPEETVTLAIDVEGPATAYSGDLVSSDGQVQPAEENVPIIDLKEGQRLELEADAELGYGKDHAKHQGGVAVGYRHLQRVALGDDRDEFAEDDPEIIRGVIEDDGELVETASFDNDLSDRYPDREVSVEDVPNAFVFDVETDGSMTVDELVLKAVESLRTRADELEAAVQL
ncbi:DNA-directed RNA polymerase subunit D [Natronomonas moolapensis 8.8.11]|uniref:DNA-directed RNA polymerase subunit Rpo3 n=1 Tax=Natronomonas moolapensis (strain DSM 18674 / CECT 7526 / JCM 14361 / 8.8.11) TaxID=268739 RepID=M1XL16_NATM8|nr:DNA-directed RNA polymerase subunit D [Natronomonas moolapensis]CCQ36905.1 DNA-directed RNA polymerase subunit D [Natronomonas moolapensis 8.8.11]